MVKHLEFSFLIWQLGMWQGWLIKSLGIVLLKLSYVKQASARGRGSGFLGAVSARWLSQNIGIRSMEFSTHTEKRDQFTESNFE